MVVAAAHWLLEGYNIMPQRSRCPGISIGSKQRPTPVGLGNQPITPSRGLAHRPLQMHSPVYQRVHRSFLFHHLAGMWIGSTTLPTGVTRLIQPRPTEHAQPFHQEHRHNPTAFDCPKHIHLGPLSETRRLLTDTCYAANALRM